MRDLLLGVLAVLMPLHANANLRAPRVDPPPPSSALSTSAAIRVVAETLQITCGTDCAVEAEYVIEADEVGQVELDFVLPVAERVSAWVGGEAVPVSTTDSVATRRGALWKATFAGVMKRGRNTVRVRRGPRRARPAVRLQGLGR